MRLGLGCVLAAVFFAIVAGGSVPMDAQPAFEPVSGILLTALAGVLVAVGLLLKSESENAQMRLAGIGLTVVAGLIVVYDLFAGGDLPSLVRLVCSLLVLGGLAGVLVKNRILQMPSVVFSGPLVVLLASLGAALLISEFKLVGVDALQFWMLCVGAYFLTTAVVGRVNGPRMVVETAVFAGALVSIKGILEYLAIRSEEPTYRIFADWNNPNALAGILVAVFPLSVALATAYGGVRRVAALVASSLIVLGIALSQSKGGLIVLGAATLIVFVTLLVWRARSRALLTFVPLVAGGALLLLVQRTPATPPPASQAQVQATEVPSAATPPPMQRVFSSQGESAQSSTYRKLLWKGAIQAWKDQPVGYGPGTYRFYSAKSGLTEQTQLAHQTYLQLAVEGGVLAGVCFFVLAAFWAVRMFKGAGPLAHDRNMLRAGVFASVMAIGANGLVESNAYFLGIGLLLFVLIATGLQLAADGTSPESLPKSVRGAMVIVICVAPLVVSVWAFRSEAAKSSLAEAFARSDFPAIAERANSLSTVIFLDDEALYLLAMSEPDPAKRLSLLNDAVAKGPRTKNLRALADEQARQGDVTATIDTLNKALLYDPNNLRTLAKLMQSQVTVGDALGAISTAERIVAVEDSTYLQVRAIPELVQTEPFSARLYLAEQSIDVKTKAQLLRAAVEGYERYRQITLPKIKAFSGAGLDFGSETLATAAKKLDEAKQAAIELEQIYSSLGDSAGAEFARSLANGMTVD